MAVGNMENFATRGSVAVSSIVCDLVACDSYLMLFPVQALAQQSCGCVHVEAWVCTFYTNLESLPPDVCRMVPIGMQRLPAETTHGRRDDIDCDQSCRISQLV
eukprot:TRINITY_DN34090_c0_g1_i1.p1 TRINITY_DN34090_c0_g1~~TRINITY_DN34090_c0_g1_i1.p1  ORF type:complete len:103 (-),score=2.90 TRINITY_DN34090_c0_g1_i1:4-312(-)